MATLTLNFTPLNPAPLGGYQLRYRALGSLNYSTLNVRTSPVVVPGLQNNVAYEGDLQTICSSTASSSRVPFSATIASPPPATPCVTISSFVGSGAPTTCLGMQYPTDTVTVVASLDAVLTYPVTVSIGYTATGCTGLVSQNEMLLNLPAGTLSAEQTLTTSSTVDCGQNNCVAETAVLTNQNRVSVGLAVICTNGVPEPGTGIVATGYTFSQRYATVLAACQDAAPVYTVTAYRDATTSLFEPFYANQAGTQQITNGFYAYRINETSPKQILEISTGTLGTLVDYNLSCLLAIPTLLGFAQSTLAGACASSANDVLLVFYSSNGQLAVGSVIHTAQFSNDVGQLLPPTAAAGFYRRADGTALELNAGGVVANLSLSCVGAPPPDPYQTTNTLVGTSYLSSAEAVAAPYNGVTAVFTTNGLIEVGRTAYLNSTGTTGVLPSGWYRIPDAVSGGVTTRGAFQVDAAGLIIAFELV